MKLLVDPLARGAYFADLESVVEAELRAAFPAVTMTHDRRATLSFVDVDLPEEAAHELVRLSFVQGVFMDEGEHLRHLDVDPGFQLPRELVWGAKYRGKTNELVTQLAIGLAARACAHNPSTLLDPMAGRGTTLLWALRFGLEAWGVEQDVAALDHLQRHVKRQTKLHRLKHSLQRGGKGQGAFLDLRFPRHDARLRLVSGDTRQARHLVQKKRFDLVVSDLPYGVQFVGARGTRNPVDLLRACAAGWAACVNPGGAMALIYNRFQPAREQLVAPFEEAGLEVSPLELPHRMSESILRDVVVFRRPATTGDDGWG